MDNINDALVDLAISLRRVVTLWGEDTQEAYDDWGGSPWSLPSLDEALADVVEFHNFLETRED